MTISFKALRPAARNVRVERAPDSIKMIPDTVFRVLQKGFSLMAVKPV